MRFNIFRNPLFLFLSDSYADNGQVAVGRVAGSHTRIDTYRSRKRWYKKVPDFSGLCLIPAKRYYVFHEVSRISIPSHMRPNLKQALVLFVAPGRFVEEPQKVSIFHQQKTVASL